MGSFQFLALLGLAGIAVTVESDYGCSNPSSPSVSISYVTVPAPPVTKTVYAPSQGVSANDGSSDIVASAFTSLLTSTQVITLAQASDQPGPYSFTEHNGTTSWLGGKTPPASAQLITSTSIITLHPVSTLVTDASRGPSAVTTTSYLTLTPTETVAHTYTKLSTQYASSVPASSKGYPRFGSAGWNASTTTFLTIKSATTGGTLIKPSIQESASSNVTSHRTTAYITATAYGLSLRHVQARQVGEIIEATIDGIAVSWTNNFDGSNPTGSEGPSFVPVTATPPAFRGTASSLPSSSPSAVQTSTSFAAGPTTTVAVYPWDLSPPSSSSSTYNITSTTVTSAVASSTSSCGEASGIFTVDFDDLPTFSAGPDDVDIPPIFNPYRKLYWEGHFGYVPPPTDPFPPHSSPQLAVYRGNGNNSNGSSDAGVELFGEIGAGPRAEFSAYWIDAHSAYLGCADGGAKDCIITVKGYANGGKIATVTQRITHGPCPGLKNCSLAFVLFHKGFRGLSGLQITATVDAKDVDYYLDDLQLGWSNNTCAAQSLRSSSR